MSDPRDEFLKGVDFNLIEVREYPKIAFLCGGNPGVTSVSSTSEHLSLSVRSCISRLLDTSHPTLHYQNAEDVKDWNSYSAYDDLIEFEKDIAHICKTIVLFVESPGSIAELGSFAIIPGVTEKLIVFVHSDYADSSSFVSLGPLKRIEDIESGKIHYITWNREQIHINGEMVEIVRLDSLGEWGKYTCDAINLSIESRGYINHASENYVRTKEALFIHDIIGLFKAVTEVEILNYFKLINHNITVKSLRRSLFCLKKLELVRSIQKGNCVYYVLEEPSSGKYLTLNISKDTLRLALQIDAYYRHHSHLTRREAISELVRSLR